MMAISTVKRTLVLAAGAAELLVLAHPAVSQQADQDDLAVIPENYKLLYENAFVRVIEARVPPGTEEKSTLEEALEETRPAPKPPSMPSVDAAE